MQGRGKPRSRLLRLQPRHRDFRRNPLTPLLLPHSWSNPADPTQRLALGVHPASGRQRLLTQTGVATWATWPVDDRRPVAASTRKVTMVSES